MRSQRNQLLQTQPHQGAFERCAISSLHDPLASLEALARGSDNSVRLSFVYRLGNSRTRL